jgi:hypothetical protein
MQNPHSRWKDHDHWQCLKHVPPVTLPHTSGRCWFAGCSERPSEALRPAWVAPVAAEPEPKPAAIVAIRPVPVRLVEPRPVPDNTVEPLPRPAAPAPTAAPASVAAEHLRCAYELCSNEARDGSKYCSRTCSNRNARRRFKTRKKAA